MYGCKTLISVQFLKNDIYLQIVRVQGIFISNNGRKLLLKYQNGNIIIHFEIATNDIYLPNERDQYLLFIFKWYCYYCSICLIC